MRVEERIACRAYEIWEQSERLDGYHNAHWQAACHEIQSEADATSSLEAIPTKTQKKAKARSSAK